MMVFARLALTLVVCHNIGASALALSPSVVANTVLDAGAAVALAAGPMFIPTIAKGYDAMYADYDGLPEGELFDSSRWRGEYPEYDLTNAPLADAHIRATISAAFFLFFGAIEQARVVLGDGGSGDLSDVYAMILYAFAFQGDSLTHAVLSSSAGTAKTNIMQKGHSLDTWPMIAFFLYANYLDGGAWYALTDLPSDHWWMLAPRLFTSPVFLFLTFYAWQPAHGAGVWLPKQQESSSSSSSKKLF